VLFNTVTFNSRTTQFTVDRCMNVLDMRFKVTARDWFMTLLTQDYVSPTVHLMDHIVALSNITLAMFTIIT